MRTVAFISLLFCLTLVLEGCATTRAYESYLDGWVGKPASDLTQQWGEPTSVESFSDGRKAYQYRFRDPHDAKSRAAKQGEARALAGAPTGCTTYFIIDLDGTIRGWKWEGDSCTIK